MGKRLNALLGISLNVAGAGSLHRQLYLSVKTAILKGRLPPGAYLPSTRTLARDLGVSRTTVLNAFDQLSVEGYLEGRVGSGTRVVSSIPGDLQEAAARAGARASRLPVQTSRRARGVVTPDLTFLRTAARPLRPGEPDVGLFPRDVWSRLAAKHWRQATRDPEHADSLGYRPLREAICRYVARLRAVRCEPDQVLIVNGAQQAIYLCAHTLLDPGDAAWLEDPGYPRARTALLSAGVKIVPVPVDAEGLVISAGRKKKPVPKLIFTTPSFQCPMGAMMSLSRRFELLSFAADAEAWVLEDDYFSEYQYGSNPAASLQSLDESDRVIYAGNFSKSIAPALRIGFLVLPPALVDQFKMVRSAISRQPSGVDQAILAEFINAGHLERHIRTALRTYRERQAALISAITEEAGDVLEPSSGGTGTYLVAWLPPGVDDRAAATLAAAAGVDVIPLSTFSIVPLRRHGLLLGYTAYDEDRIRKAVKQLAAALSRIRRS